MTSPVNHLYDAFVRPLDVLIYPMWQQDCVEPAKERRFAEVAVG